MNPTPTDVVRAASIVEAHRRQYGDGASNSLLEAAETLVEARRNDAEVAFDSDPTPPHGIPRPLDPTEKATSVLVWSGLAAVWVIVVSVAAIAARTAWWVLT